MTPLTVHYLTCCVFLMVLDGGHFTNLSLSALNDGKQTLNFLNTFEGNLQTSKIDGKLQTATTDGKLQTSAIDGQLPTSKTDGKLQTSMTNRKLQTSTTDGNIGKLQTFTIDGMLQTSTTDGKLQTFTTERRLQTFTTDGKLQTLKTDGKLQNSTTDGKLQTFTTDEHSFVRSTQHIDMCQLLNLCSGHLSSTSSNISQAHGSRGQFTTKADDFVKTSRTQILPRSSQVDDRLSRNVTHLQQETFSTLLQLDVVNPNAGKTTQSPVNQGTSLRTSVVSHTPVSSQANILQRVQTTSTPLTEGSTNVNTQISVSTSETTVIRVASTENEYSSCQEVEAFFRTLKLCENHSSGDPSRSCKGRCGQVQSFDNSFENCSCDDKCVVYNDCCIDFYTYCNHTFEQSLQMFGEKVFSYESRYVSQWTAVRAISYCSNKKPRSSTTHLTYATSTGPTAITSSHHKGGLHGLILQNNLVADLSTGLIYHSVDSYYSCNSETGPKPYIIPLVLPLRGQYIDGQSIESYVFSSQFFQYNPYILDPLPTMRGTFHEETVQCGSCPTQAVNYLCVGSFGEDKLPKLKDFSTFSIRSARPLNQIGTCSHWPSFKGGQQYWNTYYRTVLNLPELAQNTSSSYSWTAMRQMSEALSPDMVGTVTIKRQVDETYLDLEFTGAPWARLRCSHFSMPLADCQILQCSQGYLLSEAGKCWLPKSILLTTETFDANMTSLDLICQCATIYKIVKAFKIYELGRVYYDSNECRLPVTGVYDFDNLNSNKSQQASGRNVADTRDKDKLKDMNNDSGHLLNDKQKSENINDDLKKLTDFKMAILKGLIENRNDCDENFLNLRVCFVGGVHISDLRCFSYTYDDIVVTDDGAAPPQHPTSHVSSSSGHNHQSHRKLQLKILAILVVIFCVM